MPRLSIEARRRIISLVSGGFSIPSTYHSAFHVRFYSTRKYTPCVDIRTTCMHGYIPRVTIFHAWLYPTRGYIPRVTIFFTRGYTYSTRGTTRDVYVPRYKETWSTQTRNGIHWIPRVITRVVMRGIVKL